MNSFVFRAAFLTVLFLTATLLAQAQAPRTWVAFSGSDANPCTVVAPCKSFAGAISKTANAGEINCLTPGGYGAVTVNKSVTIDCTGTLGGIQVTSGNAITINPIAAVIVRIRGLSINGLSAGTNGIVMSSPGKLTVEDTVIDGFTGNGIFMQNTQTATLLVDNCSIRNNSGVGVSVQPTSTLPVTSTMGTISNSRIMNNSNQGISTSTSDFAVANCIFSGNSTGILASTNGTIRISGNTVTENFTGISVGSKGFIVSYGNNAIGGNSVSDGTPSSTVGPR
jgi:hypothetical protein